MNNGICINDKVLCVTEELFITYRNGCIKVIDKETGRTRQKCPIASWVEKNELLSRFLRNEPRCAAKVDADTYLISVNGKILKYSLSDNDIIVEHNYEKGMKNPLCFCVVDSTEEDISGVYYGEYIWNMEKGPVAIFKREKGLWKKVYEFQAGLITHVHNIVYDRYRNVFYVLTGDSDAESGIWICDPYFQSVKPLVIGKQAYRACVAFPTTDGLIYATDTPLEQNHIMKIKINTGKGEFCQELYNLPGPCIYGTEVNGKFYFATSVEPDSTLPLWRYRITSKLGKGVEDRYAHIVCVDENLKCKEVYKCKKDFLPMWLFQFGNFLFPYNTTKSVYASTQSLSCGHGKTINITVDHD